MPNITLTGISIAQALAIADGLMEAKFYQAAAMLYERFLREATGDERRQIQVRLGLARAPNPRTQASFALLRQIEPTMHAGFVGEGLATWVKTLPFIDDARFMALADKHAHLIPLPNLHWNLHTVVWAARRAARVEGDFVELGVFKGHTTQFVAEYLEFQKWPRTWFLYDTFDGVPDDQLDAGWADKNARTYKGTYSYETVAAQFAPFENIVVTKGRVPEILDEVCPDAIAFMHIDLNNTKAEIAALDKLYERVTPGGVIVFDDYGWTAARAQRDAEDRWFAARGLEILALPTGQGLFIKPER